MTTNIVDRLKCLVFRHIHLFWIKKVSKYFKCCPHIICRRGQNYALICNEQYKIFLLCFIRKNSVIALLFNLPD